MSVKKMLTRALALLAVFALLLADASLLPVPARAAGALPAEAELSAGRRKTTPTPKPKKTPKPDRATPAPTASPTAAPAGDAVTPSPLPEGPIIEPQAIADWLFAHDFTLPDNFITKKEAQALGWDSYSSGPNRYLSNVAPGMSIGGDRFGNYEGTLPRAKGRQYYECDCWYTEGKRNAYRIVFSNDGLVFYTEDHYQTFVEMHPSVPGAESAP